MKKGFILIEVVIALVISSLLAISLLSFLYQLSQVQSVVDDMIVTSGHAAIVLSQMERDLMGAFVPVLADIQLTTTIAEEKKEAEAKKEERPAEKKEGPKPIDKIFYGVNQADKLNLLTFITTNPMQRYGVAEQTKPRPRIARVVYRLVPDTERKNSYILTRQEGTELYFDAYKQKTKEMPTYDVIDGIKDVTVQYTVLIEKESEKEGEEKKTKREYKTVKEWKEQKEEEKQVPPLPTLVEIRFVLWDSSHQHDISYVFTVPIMAEVKLQQKKEQQQEQQQGVRVGQRKVQQSL